MTKHYIRWMFPGLVVTDTSDQEVKSATALPKAPENSFGFRRGKREAVKVKGKWLTGEWRYVGPIYYLGGKVKTIEDVLREQPDSILLSNMKVNRIQAVVITKFGQAMPLEKDSVIL